MRTARPLEDIPPRLAMKFEPVLDWESRMSKVWNPASAAEPRYSKLSAPPTSMRIAVPFTKLTRAVWYLRVESVMSPPTFRNLNSDEELSFAKRSCLVLPL